jgi:hypothetical protein
VADHFVAEILHAVELDAEGLQLFPQADVRAMMGSATFTARPDFLMRDASTEPTVDAVTHKSKTFGEGDLCWGPVAGEVLIAALRNAVVRGVENDALVNIVGIRAISTRSTFFKGSFTGGTLHHLSVAELEPSDIFSIHCRGGSFVDTARQSISSSSGVHRRLDYNVMSERKQLLLMLTALGKGIRARQAALSWSTSGTACHWWH